VRDAACPLSTRAGRGGAGPASTRTCRCPGHSAWRGTRARSARRTDRPAARASGRGSPSIRLRGAAPAGRGRAGGRTLLPRRARLCFHAASCGAAGGDVSVPPPSRTKWTRRVPHPVLIGHAGAAGGAVSVPAAAAGATGPGGKRPRAPLLPRGATTSASRRQARRPPW